MELLFAVESVDDGVEGGLLPACQLEGEGCPDFHDGAQVDLPLVPTEPLVFAAFYHAEAEGKQLQDFHFPLGLVDGGEFLWQVQRPQVLHDGGKVQVVRQFPGAESRQGKSWELEDGLVQPSKEFLFHPGFPTGFADGIHRQDCTAKFLVVVKGLHVGVAHLQPAVFAYRSRNQPLGAVLDALCPVARALEEQEAHFAGSVGKGGNKAVPAAADNSRPDDGADKNRPLSGLAVLDGGNLGLVQVVAGDVVEQVCNAVEARLAEGLDAFGTQSR